MKTIPIHNVETVARELMQTASINIPKDFGEHVRKMAVEEENFLGCFVLNAMLDNWDAANTDQRPMCADTGLPRYYVKVGNEAKIEGGFVALEAALRRATADATQNVPLRPNRVHPLSRIDHNNNVGIHAPEVQYAFEPDADWLEITTVHKGGLFGTDYRMLFPGDGIDGIKRFFLDTLMTFGKRGLACQPAIVGIGLGGNKDTCMRLGKEAACLRVVGDRNPDPEIASLEDELKEMGNSMGMGVMGISGRSMVADCHMEVAFTHTGGMPVSMHCFCLSSRRASARLHADGKSEMRPNPNWFTPYYRRESVS
ncbi:MAG: fumarate hydratase [Alphaproteobacteria bacterium]